MPRSMALSAAPLVPETPLRAIRPTRRKFFPVLPHVGDARFPAAPYIPVSRRSSGGGSGMRRAGKSRRSRSQGLVSRSARGLRHAPAIVPDRRPDWPVHAGFGACRPRMNVPATGIIHAGSGSLTRRGGEGRTQDPGRHRGNDDRSMSPMDATHKSNWTQGPAFLPDSAAHPLRMRPCRDTGKRAMSGPGAGIGATERTLGGRKGRSVSDKRGISVRCAAFRVAQDRSNAFRFAHDNFRYRA